MKKRLKKNQYSVLLKLTLILFMTKSLFASKQAFALGPKDSQWLLGGWGSSLVVLALRCSFGGGLFL